MLQISHEDAKEILQKLSKGSEISEGGKADAIGSCPPGGPAKHANGPEKN